MKDDLPQKNKWKVRVAVKISYCRSRPNLSEGACQKSSENKPEFVK